MSLSFLSCNLGMMTIATCQGALSEEHCVPGTRSLLSATSQGCGCPCDPVTRTKKRREALSAGSHPVIRGEGSLGSVGLLHSDTLGAPYQC